MLYGMQFIQGYNRHQTTFSTPGDRIEANNPVRLMDAFVDRLNLVKLGFGKIAHKSEGFKPRPERQGRPPYEPATLLGRYLYGY
jgi:hypothetical protein